MKKTSALTIQKDGIDQYGHLNYKAIPGLLEPFQDELLAERGTSFVEIDQTYELRSFVKKVEITWLGELREGDNCEVCTSLSLGNTSMRFQHTLVVGQVPVVELFMVVVLVSENGDPTPIPAALREQLT